jgi:hypothetical protein
MVSVNATKTIFEFLGKSKPNIQKRMFLEDTILLEAGEVVENPELNNGDQGRIPSDLQYNEFIVYDVGQVCE